ncbi:hypothetical protein [Flavobacterium sp.]|uniref:hypothetical protein n=1 Tax=Flavobacterium sp. TaxID=239 RepID=UPI0026397475|nr:hypothetical protein [Flavobacterium sp.]
MNTSNEKFWESLQADGQALDQIHDLLVLAGVLDAPTMSQIKAFVMILPQDMLSHAQSWGFCDTGVRELTYDYLEKNKDAVYDTISTA